MLLKALKIAPLLLGAFTTQNSIGQMQDIINSFGVNSNGITRKQITSNDLVIDTYYTAKKTYGDQEGSITYRAFSQTTWDSVSPLNDIVPGNLSTSLIIYLKLETPKNYKTNFELEWLVEETGTKNINNLTSSIHIYQSLDTNLNNVFNENISTYTGTNLNKYMADKMIGYQNGIYYSEIFTGSYTEDSYDEGVLCDYTRNSALTIEQIYNYTCYYLITIEPSTSYQTGDMHLSYNGDTYAMYQTSELSIQITNQPLPDNNMEVVNIPGLMFDVLTMPFTFMSIAFNLTLFPGTPYQLNLSALFLAVLGVLIFAFILKLIINKG